VINRGNHRDQVFFSGSDDHFFLKTKNANLGKFMNNKMHIKPFHLFKQKGCWCLMNIEGMRAQSIDRNTFDLLERCNTESSTALQSDLEEHLRELDLITNIEDQAKKETIKDPIPIVNMALFLTQSCNLNCIYCYEAGGGYGSGGSLDEKTAFQTVDWLIEQSGKQKKIHLGFFGGEPLLNFPMMQAVAQYTVKKRVREINKKVNFHTTTNATLLDDEKIAFIKKYDISVLVSFDGPREIQDVQRPFADGKGSYDVAVPQIKKLKSNSQLFQGVLSLLHNTKRRYPCGAGLGMAAVSCSGDIYLCHRFVGIDSYKLGNIFNNDLDRQKYHKSPVTFVEKCSKCFAKYYCVGGCKHDNVGSCGSVFEPSEDMCRLKCRETELAAYITCLLTDEDRTFLAEYEIIPDKPCPFDFSIK